MCGAEEAVCGEGPDNNKESYRDIMGGQHAQHGVIQYHPMSALDRLEEEREKR
ncbi:hypothetical protein GCM10011511_09530 [Puia dinghuensis]|uniref:Uncharacterized protein n=1 Tax=Puia dinghuensis TaxID=1792502 RepID=A0A8J2U9J8_9BACT|nr:hypothetical protein GCM10011511_09530 [Puia dinghuensis]